MFKNLINIVVVAVLIGIHLNFLNSLFFRKPATPFIQKAIKDTLIITKVQLLFTYINQMITTTPEPRHSSPS